MTGSRPAGSPATRLPAPAVDDALRQVVHDDWARMLAPLIRTVGDIALAEDCLQDALAIAVERWATQGVPEEPRAWLITTARHRAIDLIRRESRRGALEAAAVPDAAPSAMPDSSDPSAGEDDVLRLVFTCCHPALSIEAQSALSLRLLGGLTTREIARAYLVPEATMNKRLVRAKQKIAQATIPFAVPPGEELPRRVAGVARTIYLMFNEGYAATGGEVLVRASLADDALHLGELVLQLLPRDPALLGLVSLMLLQDSRRAARTAPDGSLVLLADQDRSLWDRGQIHRGVELLGAGLASSPVDPDPYVVQAAIAACHALAASGDATDWAAIVFWCDVLIGIQDTPVVRLNRAVALGERDGPAAGLAAMQAIDGLQQYPLWHAAQGELLARLGRRGESRVQLQAALALEPSARIRDHLLERLAALQD